jgi:diguanylate cyclase (GGDEF)-like protein
MPSINRPRRLSLVLIIVVFLGIAFAASAVLSYVVSKNELRTSIISDELPLTSDNIYTEIQKDLLIPVHSSRMMASDTFLRDWYLSGEKDTGAITRYLTEVKRKTGSFTSFFVSERSFTYYTADGILKKISRQDPHDVWYFSARSMKDDIHIDVDTDQAHNDALTIFINYKAFDYGKKLIGITGVGLTVNEVRNLVDRYEKRFGRSVYFSDLSGKVVLSGDASMPEGSLLKDIPDEKGSLDEILKGDGGSYTYTRRGVTRYLNARLLPQLGWYVFVERNSDTAFAPIRRVLYVNLGIAFVICLVLAVVMSAIIHVFQSRLECMAHTDYLTGLANRQAWPVISDHLFRDSSRNKTPVSVIIADIDHFKKVNDRYGHAAGDAVIREVSRRIRDCLRESDTVFRWGGEEFLAILGKCDLKNGAEIAEKIRKSVSGFPVARSGKEDILVTVSIGVVERRKNEQESLFVERSDKALYKAKRSGRNRVVGA